MGILSVRIDIELERKLDFLMKRRNIVDKSAYIRQLLSKSLKEELIDYLCSEIQVSEISIWKAAELADISLRQMLKEVAKRNIPIIDEKGLEEDLQFAFTETDNQDRE